MLVLSRRTNETLVIDNNIRFTVLSVHGNQVRIGIEAPEDIIILREEIIHHGGSRGNQAQAGAGADSTSGDGTSAPRNRYSENRSQNDPYRRHDSNPEQHHNGHEHGRRRGVLGLRRRRP